MSEEKASGKKWSDIMESLSDLEFDFEMPSYDAEIESLTKKFPGIAFEDAGGIVPFQANGTYKGLRFYFRYRWDTARLELGANAGKDKLPVDSVSASIADVLGDGLNGSLDPEEFEFLFTKLMKDVLSQLGKPTQLY